MAEQRDPYHDGDTDHGENLGKRIARLRNQRSVSQYKLSQIAKVPQSSLSRLENGSKTGLSSRSMARIADALNTSTDFLLGNVDNSLSSKQPARKWQSYLTAAVSSTIDDLIIMDSDLNIVSSSSNDYSINANIKQYLSDPSHLSLTSSLNNTTPTQLSLRFTSGKSTPAFLIPIYSEDGENANAQSVDGYLLRFDMQRLPPRITAERKAISHLLKSATRDASPTHIREQITEYILTATERIQSIAWTETTDTKKHGKMIEGYTLDHDVIQPIHEFGKSEIPGRLPDEKYATALRSSRKNRICLEQDRIVINFSMEGSFENVALVQCEPKDQRDVIDALHSIDQYISTGTVALQVAIQQDN
tara:strand:- start:749 stop:1831 length:1083 start_codon:yes stop_codon:yes gene_type:complete